MTHGPTSLLVWVGPVTCSGQWGLEVVMRVCDYMRVTPLYKTVRSSLNGDVLFLVLGKKAAIMGRPTQQGSNVISGRRPAGNRSPQLLSPQETEWHLTTTWAWSLILPEVILRQQPCLVAWLQILETLKQNTWFNHAQTLTLRNWGNMCVLYS